MRTARIGGAFHALLVLAICASPSAAGQTTKITASKVLLAKGRSICTDRVREPEDHRDAYQAVAASLKADGKDSSNLYMVIADDVLFARPDQNTVTVYLRGKCGEQRMENGGLFFVVEKGSSQLFGGGLPPDIAYMAPHWIRVKDQWVFERGYLEH